jgi:formiminoglutamate deiminase
MKWHAAYAWLPDGLARDVSIEEREGKFSDVATGVVPGDHVRLAGLVVPGMANAHSHVFHRALRGRTSSSRGSFWTWRRQMYRLAARIDPEQLFLLARAAYAEMALAGITVLGEFHYLHHSPTGQPYDDPNIMGDALREAAAEVGVHLVLLDTCYLAGGLTAAGHEDLDPVQRRFSDGDVLRWASRVEALRPTHEMSVGAAIHSVRAVPQEFLGAVAEVAGNRPLHFHVSEQRAENEACEKFYGVTPVRLLRDSGVLGPTSTAVHATHLAGADTSDLAETKTAVCICPTTERDLGDGIGPARALADAGVSLCLGSDQNVTIDLLEEARALEMDERLATEKRGCFELGELIDAITVGGYRALGREGGRIEVGAPADLVAIRLDTVGTAGTEPSQALLAASAVDVDTVIVCGRTLISGGAHFLGDVGRLLAEAIDPLWSDE